MAKIELEGIEIQGFRGVNKDLPIKLNGRSMFLFGPNGAGKTSILQSIEWCMFGQFAYLPSDEYKMQDAIVNFYIPSEHACVKLIFKDKDGRKIELKRTRKRGKSSTTGKSSIELKVDGQTLPDKQTEAELAKLLELGPEEYYARVHLHQETTRDLLFGQITDRSTMIDKMLGLYNLRSLIEAIPLGSVDREVKGVQKNWDDTEQTKNDIDKLIKESKKNLDRLIKDLENAKIAPDTVSLISLVKAVTEADDKILEIANLLTINIRSLEAPKTLEEARSIPDLLNKKLTQIENKRTEIYGRLMQDLNVANQFYDDYKNSLAEKEKLKLGTQNLAQEKQELAALLSGLNAQQKELQAKYISLKSEEPIIRRLVSENKQLQTLIDEICGKFGSIDQINARIEQITQNIKTLSNLINQQDTLSKIMNFSAQFLQAPGVETCPVCESKISKEQVHASLSNRIKENKEAKLIEKLSVDIDDNNKQKEANEKALSQLNDSLTKLQRTQGETFESRNRLKSLGLTVEEKAGPEQLLIYVQSQITEAEGQQKDISQKIESGTEKKAELEAIERKIDELTKLENKIQTFLSVQLKGIDLLNKLAEVCQTITSRTQEVANLGDRAAVLRENIADIRTMVDYLIKKKETENTEKTVLPGIQAKLDLLQKKLKEIQELGAALHDIHDAAISAQEEFLEATLSPLQNDINEFYSKLVPHPTFERLELQPEMQRGKYIYRVKALNKEGTEWTYVQTTFSLAQMNLTAISIFFAIALKDPLGFIILDDPSQSLDPEHKKALASLIAELGAREQVLVATQDEQFIADLEQETSKIKPTILNLGKWNKNGPSVAIL